MKIKNLVFGLFLISILILTGCTQQQTNYVCSDGSVQSSASSCGVCGNGICDGRETASNCEKDCTNLVGRRDNPCKSTAAPFYDQLSEKCIGGNSGV